MASWRLVPRLPLLYKELLEISARKRTYVIRVVLAVLLLIVFAMLYRQQTRWLAEAYQMLGQGGRLFEQLGAVVFFGLALFMPAMAAGVITVEKEQGSLVLLLLTPMRPLSLVLQKFGGRVLSMLSLVLLSLPLFAITYAFGGLQVEQVVAGTYLLMVTCLQIAALSVAVSAWCRTSTAAFLAVYVLLALLYFGCPVLQSLIGSQTIMGVPWDTLENICPIKVFVDMRNGSSSNFGSSGLLLGVVVASSASLMSVPFFLALARLFLVRRSTITGANVLLRVFRFLDTMFQKIDARMGRRARVDLPVADPIAWRELNRRSLANWRYLVRIFLPIFAVSIAILTLVAAQGDSSWAREVAALAFVATFILAVLSLLALGAGMIAGERMHQTLAVLLTTPIHPRRIIDQKMRALRRMGMAFMLLLAMMAAFTCFIDPGSELTLWRFAAIVVFPPTFAWIGVLCGMLVQRRIQAMALAIFVAVAWIAVIPIAAEFLTDFMDTSRGATRMLIPFSPGGFVIANETGWLTRSSSWIGVMYVGFHVVVWRILRGTSLALSERLLRRGGP